MYCSEVEVIRIFCKLYTIRSYILLYFLVGPSAFFSQISIFSGTRLLYTPGCHRKLIMFWICHFVLIRNFNIICKFYGFYFHFVFVRNFNAICKFYGFACTRFYPCTRLLSYTSNAFGSVFLHSPGVLTLFTFLRFLFHLYSSGI
jgi:hypothetical protein